MHYILLVAEKICVYHYEKERSYFLDTMFNWQAFSFKSGWANTGVS